MSQRIRTCRVRRVAVLATTLLAASAATALAAGNAVNVHAPRHAKVRQQYAITVSGHAGGTKILYIFIDYHSCAATPHKEHFGHHAPGLIYTVSGAFSETSHWNSGLAGTDHACAYLVKKSEPKNPSTGVVAHGFASYRIGS